MIRDMLTILFLLLIAVFSAFYWRVFIDPPEMVRVLYHDVNVGGVIDSDTNKLIGEYSIFNSSSSVLNSHHIECINSDNFRTSAGVILRLNRNNFVAVTSNRNLFYDSFYNYLFGDMYDTSLQCRVARHIERAFSYLMESDCLVLSGSYYYDQTFICCTVANDKMMNRLSAVKVLDSSIIVNSSTYVTYFKSYQYETFLGLNVARFYTNDHSFFKFYQLAAKWISLREVNIINDNITYWGMHLPYQWGIWSISGYTDYFKNGFYYHQLLSNTGYSGSAVTIDSVDGVTLIGTVSGWNNKCLFYGEGRNTISSINHGFFQSNYKKYVQRCHDCINREDICS